MDGERVHRAGKLLGKGLVHHPVPLHTALTRESVRYNVDPEMGLPFRSMPGMAGVEMRLVDDPQTLGREALRQFLFNPISNRHDAIFLRQPILAP